MTKQGIFGSESSEAGTARRAALVARKRRTTLLVIVGAVIVLVGATAAFLHYSGLGWWARTATEQTEVEAVQERTGAVATYDYSVEASADFRNRFDPYVRDLVELGRPTPADWTDLDVANTYFLLEYAQKTEDDRYALILLRELEQAKEAGVAVDQEGYDQQYRDALRETIREGSMTPPENLEVAE